MKNAGMRASFLRGEKTVTNQDMFERGKSKQKHIHQAEITKERERKWESEINRSGLQSVMGPLTSRYPMMQ